MQLDLLPGIFCAAHLLLRAERPLQSCEDFVAAGVALQRLWLTATAQGLHLQPEMTPVIFRWYARAGKRISATAGIDRDATTLATRFEEMAGAGADDGFAFFCRVGVSTPPVARSLRLDLGRLLGGTRPD